jgi:hypothetical protein
MASGFFRRPGNRGREWYTTGGVRASLDWPLGLTGRQDRGTGAVVGFVSLRGAPLPRRRGRGRHSLPYGLVKEHSGGYRDVQALYRP